MIFMSAASRIINRFGMNVQLMLYIFTDASVHAQTKVGFGAVLVAQNLNSPIKVLAGSVELIRFENTSSTKLELQTLLWVLNNICSSKSKIPKGLTIFTDSQNIVGLPERRDRLEKNNYYSNKGKRLNNFELYKEFFQRLDDMSFQLIKVAGHQPSHQKTQIDQIFGLVDRASRHALRGLS